MQVCYNSIYRGELSLGSTAVSGVIYCTPVLRDRVQSKIIIPMEALHKMKKIVLMTAICCLLLTAGCGSTKTKDEEKASSQKVSADDITTESFDIPPRETFAEIPSGAEQSFDCVVKTIDKNYPKAEKSVKRYYGYLGEEEVDGALSYIFAVYDSADGSHSTVATAAVTADCSRVYALDENSGQFWLIEKYEPAQKPAEFSWTVTVPAEDELTTDQEI